MKSNRAASCLWVISVSIAAGVTVAVGARRRDFTDLQHRADLPVPGGGRQGDGAPFLALPRRLGLQGGRCDLAAHEQDRVEDPAFSDKVPLEAGQPFPRQPEFPMKVIRSLTGLQPGPCEPC